MRNGKKASWLEMAVLGILGTLKLASNALAQEAKPTENPLKDTTPYELVIASEKTAEIPKPAENKTTFTSSNTFATDYVFGNGMVIGRDPKLHGGVYQGGFRADFTNGFSPFIWTDTDIQDGFEFHEVDIGATYTRNFGREKKQSNGKKEQVFAFTGGGALWTYPTKFIGDRSDMVVTGSAAYKGLPIKVEASSIWLLPNGIVDSGLFYSFKASRECPLGQIKGWDISATPSFEVALTDNFYDGTSGIKANTAGLDINVARGDHWSVRGFARRLDGKNGVKDIDYGGVEVVYTWK